jgi:hypothetical protein
VTPKNVIAVLSDVNPDAHLFENMDSALVGVGHTGLNEPVAVYSRAKIFEKLFADGFTQDDAEEFFVDNFLAVWHGENTPFILDDAVEQ